MEIYCENFDGESKKLIEELAKDSEKFNILIKKLQTARNTINKKSELIESLTEEIKK